MKLDLPEDQDYSVLIGRSSAGPLRRHLLSHVRVAVKRSNSTDGKEMIFLGRILRGIKHSVSDRMSKMDCTEDDIFGNIITHEEFNELPYSTPMMMSHSTDLKLYDSLGVYLSIN